MNIEFKNIIIEGFCSIVNPIKFSFDKENFIYLLTGKNGSGKTTIFSALSWVLYGQPLKDVSLKQIEPYNYCKGDNFRGTRVSISFIKDGIKYQIVRHQNFTGKTNNLEGKNSILIFENNELITDNLHKNDCQLFINSLLGIDYNVFVNSILFGQRLKRLIESTAQEKRELFENLFSLDFIENAKEKAKNKREEVLIDISNCTSNIQKLTYLIESHNSKILEYEKIIKTFELDKETRINELKNTLVNLDNSKKELEIELLSLKKIDYSNFDEKYNNLTTELSKLNILKGEAEITKSELLSSKNQYNNAIVKSKQAIITFEHQLKNINLNCEVCGSILDNEKIKLSKNNIEILIKREEECIKVLEQKIIAIDNTIANHDITLDLESLILKQSAIVKEIELLKVDFNNRKETTNKIDLLSSKINSINVQIDNVNQNIKYEQSKTAPQLNIEELKVELEKANKSIKKHSKDKLEFDELLVNIDWWIKTGFGSNGLKTYIFNSMLEQLNNLMLKFSSKLGIVVSISVDMTKASKPFIVQCYNNKNHLVDYNELSGGEKARVDLCLMFSINQLLSLSNNFNLLIFDESFEGLDEYGLYDVFELLREICQNKVVFVITHRNDIDTLYSKSILIEKINNSTVITE